MIVPVEIVGLVRCDVTLKKNRHHIDLASPLDCKSLQDPDLRLKEERCNHGPLFLYPSNDEVGSFAMTTYYLDQLSPHRFQELVSTLLIARFGECIRITPYRGSDGGRDAETPPMHQIYGYVEEEGSVNQFSPFSTPPPGRYLFQVKHQSTHSVDRTGNWKQVLTDFRAEVTKNVLPRQGEERVNHFFLVTNVPSTRAALECLDEQRREILEASPHSNLNLDVWWYEHVAAMLNMYPSTWAGFSEIFPGNVPPPIATIAALQSPLEGPVNALKLSLTESARLDESVKFQQIDLHLQLASLFVDLEVYPPDDLPTRAALGDGDLSWRQPSLSKSGGDYGREGKYGLPAWLQDEDRLPALESLLDEEYAFTENRILLQGEPGQGKSTITQTLAQAHRAVILQTDLGLTHLPRPAHARVPIRLELRRIAETVTEEDQSLEWVIAQHITQSSGGISVGPDYVHEVFRTCPSLLILDGLDEVGSEARRERLLDSISASVSRLSSHPESDVKVIITTRPPAATHHAALLQGYSKYTIAPMRDHTIQNYVDRWTRVQGVEEPDRQAIIHAYQSRSQEHHVKALATNPMQLAILLHFIRLKGEAFPARRADLYNQYFHVVIDRDVAKIPDLAEHRELVEALHEFLGYKIHALSESGSYYGSLSYHELQRHVREWLIEREEDPTNVSRLLQLGQERLCLLVALAGEGTKTRYGFSVQPVREYFAAAYVQHQGAGNAHRCLIEFIMRPYWWEVGIFLAGLARTNEKADIILRAREIDMEPQTKSFQYGRQALLKLAEEGVLDSPASAYNHAMIHLLSGFEEDAETRSSLGRRYFLRLKDTLNRRITEHVKDAVKDLLVRKSEVSDHTEQVRMSWFKFNVLSCEDACRDEYLQEPSTTNALVTTRIFHPAVSGCSRGVRVHEVFASTAPHREVIKAYSYVPRHTGAYHDVEIPESIHFAVLADLFLSNSYLPLRINHARGASEIASRETSAAWALIDCQKTLLALGLGLHAHDSVENFRWDVPNEISWSGLPTHVRDHGDVVIRNAEAVINQLMSSDSRIDDVQSELACVSNSLKYWIEGGGVVAQLGVIIAFSFILACLQPIHRRGAVDADRAVHEWFRLTSRNPAMHELARLIAPYSSMGAGNVDESSEYALYQMISAQPPLTQVGRCALLSHDEVISIEEAVVRAWTSATEHAEVGYVQNMTLQYGVVVEILRMVVPGREEGKLKRVLSGLGVMPVEIGWLSPVDSGSEVEAWEEIGEALLGFSDWESLPDELASGLYVSFAALGRMDECPDGLFERLVWARWEIVRDYGRDVFRNEFAVRNCPEEDRGECLRRLARGVKYASRCWPAELKEVIQARINDEVQRELRPIIEMESELGIRAVE